MSSTKLTQKQYQLIVETQGKDIADSMALALGVASSRIGKMQYAPKPVLQAWDTFQDAVRDNLATWNDNLPAGVPHIVQVDANCKK
tara:strand:+ start:402 stop:659 length:258 start_codon:yes stop_codon:yes gene_type:complete